MSKQESHLYEFGPYRLLPQERQLLRGGEPVALTPKAFEILVALVERCGRLVEKDELLNEVWAGTIVEESNIAQNVFALRRVLGRTEEGAQYIGTVPKRGYRFLASVKVFEDRGDELFVQHHLRAASSQPDPQVSGSGQEEIVSLAVLPLVNACGDARADYLSDGITESIISTLSQLPQLHVMARGTVFHYRNREVDPRQIGRELGVQALLTGRLLELDDRLVIRAELIDVANGWQLWGAQYNREPNDILALQQEMAQEISRNLSLKLTGAERRQLAKSHTENTEAYRFYLKGRYYLNKRLTETLRTAIEQFQQAINSDTDYALAYVGLADCYSLLSLYSALTPKEAFPKAKAAALRALEIDNTLAEAYTSLGVIKVFYEWDWAGAEREFEQALMLNPGYADAHQRYGIYLVAMGRFDEAIEEFRCAQELDPLSLITITMAGYPFYYGREYDRAIEQFRKTLEMDPNFSMAHFRLALAYEQKGLYEEAIAELETSKTLSDDRDVIAALGHVYALMGRREEAERALAELQDRASQTYVSSYHRAAIHTALGEKDHALEWLERACDERSYWLIYLGVDPLLDSLRDDARFTSLMQRVGLSA
jgi:TolB-like protein